MEFILEDGITDVEALRLIETPHSDKSTDDSWKKETSENHEALHLDLEHEEVDPFSAKLGTLEASSNNESFTPVIVNRKNLLSMNNSSVLICRWNSPLRYQYYKNLLPELQVTMCYSCFKVL